MNQTSNLRPAPEDSARLAGSILKAMAQGNLAGMDDALDSAERLRFQRAEFSSHDSERLELLSAVACDLRKSVARCRHLRRLEGTRVHLLLLQHLAGRTSLFEDS